MKNVLSVVIVLVLAGGAAVGGIIWSGTFNVAADEPHSRAVYRLLEIARERSVAVRAASIEVPALADEELIRKGAGNYAAMCEGCHLRPGLAESELRRGLYPQPPALAAREPGNPARDFWVIKHGLKATGMPAWGLSMDDRTIWGMVAFLQSLPGQSAADYQAAVAASSGHSHGGMDDEHVEHANEHEHESQPEPQPASGSSRDHDGHDHEH